MTKDILNQSNLPTLSLAPVGTIKSFENVVTGTSSCYAVREGDMRVESNTLSRAKGNN